MANIVIDVAAEIIETEGKVDLDFEEGPKFSKIAPTLSVQVIREDGLAGWSEVRLVGEEEDIKKFLKDFYCYDEEDFDFHCTLIEA